MDRFSPLGLRAGSRAISCPQLDVPGMVCRCGDVRCWMDVCGKELGWLRGMVMAGAVGGGNCFFTPERRTCQTIAGAGTRTGLAGRFSLFRALQRPERAEFGHPDFARRGPY